MSADEATPEHLHPIALLSGLGKAVRNLFGGIAAGGYFAFKGQTFVALMMLGGIAGVTLAGLLLHWWRFSFRVGADAIRIDSGILSRTHRTIPYDRIQDVSISQSPVHRLAGVARVTLETGSSTAGKDEGDLEAISLARAEALRELVRARRTGAVAAVETQAMAEPPPLFAMDACRVLTLGLLSFSLALFAALFGATQTIGNVIDFDPFRRKFWEPILAEGGWLLDHRIGAILGGLVIVGVAGLATGVIRTGLREWGFTLTLTGRSFRRRRGLLTRTDVSLPLRRIQAGVIATGPVRERLGWVRLAVESLASDASEGKQREDHVLAPLARPDELAPVLHALGWEAPGPETAWRMVDRAHVTSFCVALLPVFPLLLLLAPLRWLDWKRTAYALEAERLLIRTGWWRRRLLILPLANIQTVDLTENALGRRFGIAALTIAVAGGSAGGHHLPSLPRNDASLLHRRLLSPAP
ncbi:PH domain-containing protein [Sphingomonas rosea]|uniref:PH domain-containing protein n=1 Tax=Sphingomonas rosea TaxID=335605 RepID=A0ABP7TN51_9SPHN